MTHETDVEVRSYELDSFGHVNHAVFLHYFEYARFQALADAGFPADVLLADGSGIHVVRVEVDYLKEARLQQRLRIRTRPARFRNSSLHLEQTALDPSDPERVFARARVVVVWVDSAGRPTRIPDPVRTALGEGDTDPDPAPQEGDGRRDHRGHRDHRSGPADSGAGPHPRGDDEDG